MSSSSPPIELPESQAVGSPSISRDVSTIRFSQITFILLCLGHFAIDISSSALSGLQPVLRDRMGLSLTEAGVLGGVFVFSSSLMQPLYGWLSDRFTTRHFTVLSPVFASASVALFRYAPNFHTLLALVFLAGIGIAAFHPQGTAMSIRGASSNRGRLMAIFVSSGTLGFAVGPSFFAALVTYFGFESLIWSVLPGALISGLLYFYLPGARSSGHAAESSNDWGPLLRVWKPITILFTLVFLRSAIQVTYAQMLPLYLDVERGLSLVAGNYLVSLYLICGAMGGFLGGSLADRFGGRQVILVSMAGTVPFMLLFFLTTGWISALGLCLGGLVLLFTIPVNVLMAQDLVPEQSATVSSLMMGFAWGAAGLLFVPLTGWLSDRFSLQVSMMLLLIFPIIGVAVTLLLPRTIEEQRQM
ncbi:MAG: MFS transporter [Bryobacterales bacterium]|nr:MFS transporter [Bryobacterales bacterium]